MFPQALRPAARVRHIATAVALAAALASTQAQAGTYTEVGDSGQTQATAQVTTGAGALTDILGSLASSLDADLYVINITNPAAFSASTLTTGVSTLDTQLFLLTLAGAPVYLNDDESGGILLQSLLPAGSALGPTSAGLYILGVAMSGYNPVNINNQLLFASGLSTSVLGPASGLQPAVLGGFFDSTFFPDSGSYDIKLTGAIAAAVPEPASGLLLLAGGALCAFVASRRRAA